MCVDCGCSDGAKATVTNIKTGKVSELWRTIVGALHDAGHIHDHARDHDHPHDHGMATATITTTIMDMPHSHDHAHGHGHSHGVVDLQQRSCRKTTRWPRATAPGSRVAKSDAESRQLARIGKDIAARTHHPRSQGRAADHGDRGRSGDANDGERIAPQARRPCRSTPVPDAISKPT